jgi:hypothetical protein
LIGFILGGFRVFLSQVCERPQIFSKNYFAVSSWGQFQLLLAMPKPCLCKPCLCKPLLLTHKKTARFIIVGHLPCAWVLPANATTLLEAAAERKKPCKNTYSGLFSLRHFGCSSFFTASAIH